MKMQVVTMQGVWESLPPSHYSSSGHPRDIWRPIMGDKMVSELHAVIEELGGESVLGRSLRIETDLQAAIREGFPQTVVEEVMHATGLTPIN